MPKIDSTRFKNTVRQEGVEIYATRLLKAKCTSPEIIGEKNTLIPLSFCNYEQDSSNNPCPCHGPIVWLKRNDILSQKIGVAQGESGELVDHFLVANGAITLEQNGETMTIERRVENYNKKRLIKLKSNQEIAQLAKIKQLHNRYLDFIAESMLANSSIIEIILIEEKQSLIIQNYQENLLNRLIRENVQTRVLDSRKQEILMGIIDKIFGRLARLSNTSRNWANPDLSLFTNDQKKALRLIKNLLSELKTTSDIEHEIHELITTLSGRITDKKEAIPLYSAAYIAIASYAYWNNKKTMRKWEAVLNEIAPSLRVCFPASEVLNIIEADALGAGLGAISGCLGCEYIKRDKSCIECAGTSAVAGAVTTSFVWILGNTLFSSQEF